MVLTDDRRFECRRCATARPPTCLACGSTAFKNLRAGVTRVREELEALARVPVVEVTGAGRAPAVGDGDGPALAEARVYVGTEAVLHQVGDADVVAFLDFDQELLAPRYRAAEEALALLVRAARLVGGRRGGGRVLVQTRLPHHEVIQAALLGDPARVSAAERRAPRAAAVPAGRRAGHRVGTVGRRRSSSAWAAAGRGRGRLGPSDDQWLVRAADHATAAGRAGRRRTPAGPPPRRGRPPPPLTVLPPSRPAFRPFSDPREVAEGTRTRERGGRTDQGVVGVRVQPWRRAS